MADNNAVPATPEAAAAPIAGVSMKNIRWTNEEKFEFLIQIINQLLAAGKAKIQFNKLRMPGRSTIALTHAWNTVRLAASKERTKLEAELGHDVYVSNEYNRDGGLPSLTKGINATQGRKRGHGGEEMVKDDDAAEDTDEEYDGQRPKRRRRNMVPAPRADKRLRSIAHMANHVVINEFENSHFHLRGPDMRQNHDTEERGYGSQTGNFSFQSHSSMEAGYGAMADVAMEPSFQDAQFETMEEDLDPSFADYGFGLQPDMTEEF